MVQMFKGFPIEGRCGGQGRGGATLTGHESSCGGDRQAGRQVLEQKADSTLSKHWSLYLPAGLTFSKQKK